MPTNGWNEYKKLFISEMEANKKFRDETRTILGDMREDIAGLKVKAAIAGGMAGIVATGIVSMVLAAFK